MTVPGGARNSAKSRHGGGTVSRIWFQADGGQKRQGSICLPKQLELVGSARLPCGGAQAAPTAFDLPFRLLVSRSLRPVVQRSHAGAYRMGIVELLRVKGVCLG
ncbi:hypothetical protein MRX96_042254 [Rhipicephalus microplus]